MSGLALQNVTKQFGTFTAVKNVDLTVPHGTFVCLLGPSGCGKTTLMRMVAGLDLPTGGAIQLDGAETGRRQSGSRPGYGRCAWTTSMDFWPSTRGRRWSPGRSRAGRWRAARRPASPMF